MWLGLANALRERGFDVLHVYEAQRGGMSDADQLAYAAREGRAILSHNTRDFELLAAESYFGERAHHFGLILSPQISKSALRRRTLNLLRSLSATEIAGTVRYLSNYR